MQTESSLRAPGTYVHDQHGRCPLCRWKLIRQRRRTVDRLWSLIQPVKRYRCENFSCQWVGNVATGRTEAAAIDKVAHAHYDDYTEERLPRRVPIAFIVHMVLVAVGIVFVLVYSTMEQSTGLDDAASAAASKVFELPAEQTGNRADTR